MKKKTLAAAAIAAGTKYVFDPQQGGRRRAVARDKAVRLTRKATHFAGAASRDAMNRAKGVAAQRIAMFRAATPDDRILEERVRETLGRATSHPRAIEVEARDGVVTLRGPVLTADAERLVERVAEVNGVRELDAQLDVHDDPGNVPGLRGEGRTPQGGASWARARWMPATRMLAGLAGAGLLANGLIKRRVLGTAKALGGAALLTRAVVNEPARSLVGADGRRAIDVMKSIRVQAPVEDVYTLWRDYERFPDFMSHVREVRELGGGRSHWVVDGPAGTRIAWDAEMRDVPNEMIAWRTVDGSPVDHAGTVRFTPEEDGSTTVHVRMTYTPVAGAVGHTIATMLNRDPKHQMDDHLMRFKAMFEQGVKGRHARAV